MNEARTRPGAGSRESRAVETVPFSLDDVDYEIDLSTDRATRLRQLLERYIRAGRRRPGTYFTDAR
ncbi:Lsr2 dimerization domain-containing protein [Amycolatopsis regifaucium]|uniref:Lsr2 dimerization domain-containing protein n=1 Tax=Amycolatopsis regifaucium TaxID=546365 RepID=A0A154MUQ3_9PSEU|nr:hypothetical protein AVL48_18685 [Amycolatopsis regifaucium]OKA04486.1 hypothetical protein ATP06_0231825 [Amycolatopsis regifaucium]SFH50239.1 Lsr2 protein [Amycolatopsis regifaucium]